MNRLEYCLKLFGKDLSAYHQKQIKNLNDDYLSKKFKPEEASQKAVLDLVSDLERDYDEIKRKADKKIDLKRAYKESRGIKEKPLELEKVEKDFGKKLNKLADEESQKGSLELRREEIEPIPSRTKIKPFKFQDPQKETRWQQSKKSIKDSISAKLIYGLTKIKNQLSREFEYLPRTGEFAEARFAILKLLKQKGVANRKTVQLLRSILSDLNKTEYDLFSRKIVLDDLLETVKEEKSLPLGFKDIKDVESELNRVNQFIENNPKIKNTIEKRNKVWEALKSDYTEAMQDIGFDVSKRLKREKYYRHQILEYVNLKGIFGTGKKLKIPKYRGFLKERKGSELDIMTDYITAESEVIAQMIYDMEIARTIKIIDNFYNIIDKLKKEHNENWIHNIPENYDIWQPEQGNVFYMTDSIPARLASELVGELIDEAIIKKADIRKVLAIGRKKRQFVLPNELIETLNKIVKIPPENAIISARKSMMNFWKKWQLQMPRRFFKYNIRNLSGDADATFTGNPSGFKYTPRATKELYDAYNGKQLTKDLKDWHERGGELSTLQAQEIGNVNMLQPFIKLYDPTTKIHTFPIELAKKYWRTARIATDFREMILRYANYLSFLEQMKKATNGKPKTFAASLPDEIMGLSDIKDRAYWLSNDLLGAYDRVSVIGQGLRQYWWPFWSFKELNFKRYYRMFTNAANDGKLSQIVGRKAGNLALKSPLIAYRIGKFLIKASALTGVLMVWNSTRRSDEEKDLPHETRIRPHITFGRDENGDVIYFPRVGALGELLETLGLDAAPGYIEDLRKGKKTPLEIAKEMAKAPIDMTIQGTMPFAKLSTELLSRRAFFPDAFNPRTIRDRTLHLARSFGFEDEYRAISRKPSKPYEKSTSKFFVYKIDPHQASYSDIYDEKQRYLKKIGKFGEGFWLTPKGDALYNLKLAMRYKDKVAQKKYMIEYLKYCVGKTPKEISNDMIQSFKMMEPLSGLNEAEKITFFTNLDEENKKKLFKAYEFWAKMFEQ